MYLVCILGGIEIFDSLKFLKIFGDKNKNSSRIEDRFDYLKIFRSPTCSDNGL